MIIFRSYDLVQGGFLVPPTVVVFEGAWGCISDQWWVSIPDLYRLILNSKEWEMTGNARKTTTIAVNEQ